jgi:PAS domain S-box-containing protein
MSRKRQEREGSRPTPPRGEAVLEETIRMLRGDEADPVRHVMEAGLREVGADFVVIYEYIAEQDDVLVPPLLVGEIRRPDAITTKGARHKSSRVFEVLHRNEPFYAERGESDWIRSVRSRSFANDQSESFFQREGVTGSAAFPLRIAEETVGVLFVNYRNAIAFSEEVKQRLIEFASQVAAAVGGARFVKRVQGYRLRLETLIDIGRELGASTGLSVSEFGQLVEEQTQRLIDTQNLFMALWDRDRSRFYIPHHTSQRDVARELEARLSEGLTAYVAKTAEPLLARAAKQRQLFTDGHARLIGEPSAVWLGAPMVIRKKVVGVLVVQDYEDESKFSDSDLQWLSAVASQAAIAIDNRWHLEDASNRLEELSALLVFAQSLRDPVNLRESLTQALDKLCRIVGGDASLVLHKEPGRPDGLRVVASSGSLSNLVGKTFPINRGVARVVFKEGHEYLRNDYDTWGEHTDFIAKTPAKLPKRVCGVPLIFRREVIGVLTLASNGDPFGKRELDILSRLAGPMALAMGHANEAALLQEVVDRGPNAIVVVNERGRVTAFNEAAEALFGYEASAIIGKPSALLYWNNLDAQELWNRLLEQGKHKRDVLGKTKAGEQIPLLVTTALLKDLDEPHGAVGIIEDTRADTSYQTELLNAANDLSVELLLAATEDQIVDAMLARVASSVGTSAAVYLHREGNTLKPTRSFPSGIVDTAEARKFTLSVRASCLFSGHEEWTSSVCPACMGCRGITAIAALRNSPVLVPNVLTSPLAPLVARAGDSLGQSEVAFPLVVGREVVGVLNLYWNKDRDLRPDERYFCQSVCNMTGTALRYFHLFRRTTETAIEDARGEMARDIVHVVTAPVSAGTIHVITLKKILDRIRAGPTDRNGVAEAVRRAEAECDSIAELFRQQDNAIRPYTRTTLREESPMLALDLRDSSRDLQTMLANAAALKYISLKETSIKGVPRTVVASPSDVYLVLWNLYHNAIKFTRGNTRTSITTSIEFTSKEVKVRIRDQGVGIPADVMTMIWNSDFSTIAPGATSRTSGRGLFTVKLLTAKLESDVQVEWTTPNRGTQFLWRIFQAAST